MMNESQPTLAADPLLAFRTGLADARKLKGDLARREARYAVLRSRREVLSALSVATLRRTLNAGEDGTESLVWFWFNHFNVFWQKDLVGAALPDYVDGVIRPRVQGRFRDLLLGVMTHPAMLVYLDNARNVAGKINENYARELLELHTLGVDGGYTQADVQEVARVLTGFGLRPLRPVKWPPKLAPLVVEEGEFLFDPRRHDFGDKQVLGRTIAGKGFAEAEGLADLLARHPATAPHLARRLCWFFVGEGASQQVIDRVAQAFTESDGDLGSVTRSVREAAADRAATGDRTFKDPYRWVVSGVGLLAAGTPVKDVAPIARWLRALGQPLFGCRTPDGYSLEGSDWVSSGQLTQRFEIARELVNSSRRVLAQPVPLKAVLTSAPVRQVEAGLGAPSRQALEKAGDDGERLALLLSSPEFMHW